MGEVQTKPGGHQVDDHKIRRETGKMARDWGGDLKTNIKCKRWGRGPSSTKNFKKEKGKDNLLPKTTER